MIQRNHACAGPRWPCHDPSVHGLWGVDASDWDRAGDEAARKVFSLAVPMGLSYAALVLLFLAAGSYMTRLPAISAGFVAGFLTILAARLLLCRSEKGWRAHHPRRWVRVHGILSLSTGTLWSLFCCVALIVDGFTVITMLLLVSTAAISAVASAQLAPFLGVAQGFHGVTLIPVALLSAVTLGSEGLLLGGIVLTYLGFHLRMAKVHHRAHWQSAVHTALLRTRERTHALLAAALEHAGEAVEITDAQGRVEYVNPAFERMTGYSRDEARHRHIASLHPPGHGGRCRSGGVDRNARKGSDVVRIARRGHEAGPATA
jgi:PAS domain-containing protein